MMRFVVTLLRIIIIIILTRFRILIIVIIVFWSIGVLPWILCFSLFFYGSFLFWSSCFCIRRLIFFNFRVRIRSFLRCILSFFLRSVRRFLCSSGSFSWGRSWCSFVTLLRSILGLCLLRDLYLGIPATLAISCNSASFFAFKSEISNID